MYIKKQLYAGKEVDVLFADEGFILEHKITHLRYGSVTLKDGRKQDDYNEIPEEESNNTVE